jgi:CheY-like chemotaxis protein
MLSTTPKILVIDDSSVNNYLIENILMGKGYELFIAYSGTEALNYLRTITPDLILLDIMMPGIDGYEILETIGSDNNLKNIPVIIVTARNEYYDKEKALNLGAVDYIVKPINVDTLLEKIKKALKK